MREVSRPICLSFAEALAQAVEDGAIAYLRLTIAMWIVWRRERMGDFVLGTKGSHFLASEVRPVVGDGVRVGQIDI